MSFLILSLMLLLFAGFVALEVRMVRRSQGQQRWLALLPALFWVGWGLFILISVLVEPTSHNLWPFELVLLTFGGLVYLGFFALWNSFRK